VPNPRAAEEGQPPNIFAYANSISQGVNNTGIIVLWSMIAQAITDTAKPSNGEAAMMGTEATPAMNKEELRGGIDLNSANLNMQIKRDGNGVPLPVSEQDLSQVRIDGLVPVILSIQPAGSLPALNVQ
jgi:hypothetical protein